MLVVSFVNRVDLLKLAIRSIKSMWPHALIIDNSETGLDPICWPVQIARPPVPLTLSQTMNLLQHIASKKACDAFFFMHNDAEAGTGTPERLLAIIEEALLCGKRWGVAFTNYDALAAFNMKMVQEVGPWDTTLPQYFADNDYYRRVRLMGYDLIDTGLQVLHHNNASCTIKNDPFRMYMNSVTFPYYQSYYKVKWGGGPGEEVYNQPFNQNDFASFAHYLRGQDLFRQLAATYETVEGNLLELADERTMAAQLAALRYAIRLSRPRKLLEAGTGKCMFGYILSKIVHDVTLYTFDADVHCLEGVNLLNLAQADVKVEFICGDTKQTLPAFSRSGVDLAWIDGGHDEATSFNDIRQAMRLGIPVIAIDDSRIMPGVASAIQLALKEHPEYRCLPNPFFNDDSRGIVFLRRIQGNGIWEEVSDTKLVIRDWQG